MLMAQSPAPQALRRSRRPPLFIATVLTALLAGACDVGVDLDPALADAPMPGRYDPVDAELADAGAWLFQHNCSACHHIGDATMIGPDLDGVTGRRSLEWIAAMIRRPDSMLVADSVAQRLLAEYKVPMANRRLDGARVRALVEFLRRADVGPGPSPSSVERGRTEAGIAWERAGAGPPVVLIHGTNLDRRIWQGVRHRLGTTHSVISYDLRSHGESADATGPWSELDDLADVLEAAAVTDLDSLTLVGMSAGAGIALEYALEQGEAIRRLVLVSPSVRGFTPEAGEVPDVFGPLMAALGTGETERIGDAMVALPTFAVPAVLEPEVDAIVRDNLRLFRIDPAWARLSPTPPLERLSEVRAETVVIDGGRDFAATASLAALITGDVPTATRFSLPDAGHLLALTHADALQRAVLLPFPELRP